MNLILLAVFFALIAFVYASVGFGGGSSYLALLVLWGLPYAVIPAIALVCNIVVVLGSSFHYVRAGYLNIKLLLPLVMTSIPLSFLGGRLEIEKALFLHILFWALLASGIRLLIQYQRYDDNTTRYKPIRTLYSASIGGFFGFLAGITGIGGGIYLAPILYNLRAGSPKQIACITSLFILLNSLAGLIGQLQKYAYSVETLSYWYLPVLAFVGGQLGNRMMLKFIPARIAALLTAALVLFVTAQLGIKIWGESP